MKRNSHTTNLRRQMQHAPVNRRRHLIGQFVTASLPTVIAPEPGLWIDRRIIKSSVKRELERIAA